MTGTTLILSSMTAAIAGGVFLAAGINVRRRSVSQDAEEAVDLLSIWWVGLAVTAVAGATTDLTLSLGIEPFSFLLALHYARLIALCLAIWGLTYYVAFVFTGATKLKAPIAVGVSLYYAILLFLLTLARPAGFALEPLPHVELADPLVDAPLLAALLVIPAIFAGGTFLALWSKTSEMSQRARVVLVAGATQAWFGATFLREARVDVPMVPLALALLAALAALWAYSPAKRTHPASAASSLHASSHSEGTWPEHDLR